jgi:hypothetical protein
LILRARSIVHAAIRKQETEGWLHKLLQRRNANFAAVALANRNAKIARALLAHGRAFQNNYIAHKARMEHLRTDTASPRNNKLQPARAIFM